MTEAGKAFKGRVFGRKTIDWDVEKDDGTTVLKNTSTIATNKENWALLIMRDRGITKTWNALKRDLIAIGQTGKVTLTNVNAHYNQIRENIEELHTIFQKNLEAEYSAGHTEEEALDIAYANIGPLIISACKRAEIQKPIAQIVKLAKSASLNVSN
jgi:hypothetical protein